MKETNLAAKKTPKSPASKASSVKPKPVNGKSTAAHIDWQQLETDIEAAPARQNNDPGTGSAGRIRALILAGLHSGAIWPGMRLKEVELGTALQVSRTPLREALTQLKTERVLEADKEGLRVRKVGWGDIRSFYELRGTLEGLAAKLTAQRATPAERHLIDQLLAEEKSLIERKASPEILAKHNRRFHASICKASGNHFLEEHLNQLSQMMVLLGATVYSMETRLASILAEHEKINIAIQKGQPDAAEQAMRVHLEAGLIARLHLISQAEHPQMD